MRTLSLVWGIVVLGLTLIALIPCLGWMNWFGLILAATGMIIAIIDLAINKDEPDKISYSIIGLICCIVAIPIGIVRLILGLGVW